MHLFGFVEYYVTKSIKALASYPSLHCASVTKYGDIIWYVTCNVILDNHFNNPNDLENEGVLSINC